MSIKFLAIFCIPLFVIMACIPLKNSGTSQLEDLMEVKKEAIVFGEHIVSTRLYERDLAISPDMDEIIFTRGDLKQRVRGLLSMKKIDGVWQDAEVLNISGIYHDIEPFFDDGGNRLYFASNRPVFGDESRSDYNIWYADRSEDGWSIPVALDSVINSKNDEFYPSLSKNGNLYFTATREKGFGKEDIYFAKKNGESYHHPEILPSSINSDHYEFNAFISPDEAYIIFSSYGRKDGYGGGDLYVSEKGKDGNWAEARNLGPGINSASLDYSPFVDNAMLNFYFTSEKTDLPKNQSLTIDYLKMAENNVKNGFGNIYKIDFKELGIKQ